MLINEKGQFQILKQVTNLLTLGVILLTNLLRGGSSYESIAGVTKCTLPDWFIIAACIVICPLITIFSLWNVRKEYALKEKYNRGLVPSDLRFGALTVCKLLVTSFIGGIVCGALGLGGGTIFNPILISMGVPPHTSSATGKYMIMYSKISSCVVYIIYGQLNIYQGLVLGAWKALGGVILLYFTNLLVKKLNRQSVIVLVLTFILGASGIIVPILGARDERNQISQGANMMAVGSIC